MLKKTAVILSIILAGCASSGDIDERAPFNTELFCPASSYRFLILYTRQEDVMRSIDQAIEYKRQSNKQSRYTVLQLPHNQSTSIYNVTPEELKNCIIREIPRTENNIN